MTETLRNCEVCHKLYAESAVIAVEGIAYLRWERLYPWYVCHDCAEKISDAWKGRHEKQSTPLNDMQKGFIKIFLDNQCTDGYLAVKLGVADWKDAQKLIEQYKREVTNG